MVDNYKLSHGNRSEGMVGKQEKYNVTRKAICQPCILFI